MIKKHMDVVRLPSAFCREIFLDVFEKCLHTPFKAFNPCPNGMAMVVVASKSVDMSENNANAFKI